MRLSDAGVRRRPTKLIYLNHRPPPWLTEHAPRDRSNRWLDGEAAKSLMLRRPIINITFLYRRDDEDIDSGVFEHLQTNYCAGL
jgi:hypothetical protein